MTSLQAARKRHRFSALLALRTARQATQVRGQGIVAVATVVKTAQIANAVTAEVAVAEMLAEQSLDQAAEALLNAPAFTTSVDMLTGMIDQIAADADAEFERLVASLVQDAGRSAENVATAVRPNVGWVRQLTPPSCSRCVVLAGRVYRYSDGFLRHPGDDCVTVPVAAGDTTLVDDPRDLIEAGMVTGLSKADRQAIADGADFAKVVNIRLQSAGLTEAGRVLARRGKLTPEGIYARTGSNREAALELLQANGYLL